jgi:hypothetical protein
MSTKTRVRELEKHKHNLLVVYAVWYEDAPTVQVCGSDEILTPDEFKRKYPDGDIIHVVYEYKPIEPDDVL